MERTHFVGLLLSLSLTVGGCASIGLNSVVMPNFVTVQDYESVQFLQGSPKISPYLGMPGGKRYDEDGVVLALSITGGGARAAGFTLGALSELQNIMVLLPGQAKAKSALDLVDFASSNSGGSWGLASYLADRTRCAAQPLDPCHHYVLESRRQIISQRLKNATLADNAAVRFERFTRDLLLGVNFRDVRNAGLPDAYINAALSPVQSPFVFEAEMLSYYGVKNFIFQKYILEDVSYELSPLDPVGRLPLGVAAFASGAVPGWSHVSAKTNLCEIGEPLTDNTVCKGLSRGAYLQLVDGGIYDNYGYRTAFEVFDALPEKMTAPKVLIQIDNTTNLPPRTVADESGPDLGGMLMAISFLQQDEVFRRTFEASAKARDVRPVVLNLFSTATPDRVKPADFVGLASLYCKSLGLEDGKFFDCLEAPQRFHPDPEKFGIAAFDVSRLSKTSFLFDYHSNTAHPEQDWGLGTIMWQSGRLSVRRQVNEICKALLGREPRTGECYLNPASNS